MNEGAKIEEGNKKDSEGQEERNKERRSEDPLR